MDSSRQVKPEYRSVPIWKKVLRAAAVGLYIISMIPLIVLGEMGMDTLGLCGTLSIVAVATVAIIAAGGNSKTTTAQKQEQEQPLSPEQELRKAVKMSISTIGLVVYILLSFLTQAWGITWLVFPIVAAVQGLARAILDLREAGKYEN